MTVPGTLLWKHEKLFNAVVCPTCRGRVRVTGAQTLNGIPLMGNIYCQGCGDIGRVYNGKFVFGCNDLPQFGASSADISGKFEATCRPISPEHLAPEGAWQLSSEQFYSDVPGARFSIRSRGIGVAITLLKHPWSGIAQILRDGELIAELDLFEPNGSMRLWYPVFLGGGEHLVEVVVTGKRDPRSHGAQVFVLEQSESNVASHLPSEICYPWRNNGNPYPDCLASLMAKVCPDGLILDCGCGDRSHPDPRVISFEYSRFQCPDVFGDGHRLPFADNTFELVLSQAVFEHLEDPFVAAREIHRVLKPGGVVYVESAFMQPLHAVPYHFFNTTGWGLERLFRDFEIVEVRPHGKFSETLEWCYGLTSLRASGQGGKLDDLLNIARQLDSHISEQELRYFSSFVSLLGKKQGI